MRKILCFVFILSQASIALGSDKWDAKCTVVDSSLRDLESVVISGPLSDRDFRLRLLDGNGDQIETGACDYSGKCYTKDWDGSSNDLSKLYVEVLENSNYSLSMHVYPSSKGIVKLNCIRHYNKTYSDLNPTRQLKRELVVKSKDLHSACFGGHRPQLATHVDYRYKADRADLQSAVNCNEIRGNYYQLFRREVADPFLTTQNNKCATNLRLFLNHPTTETLSLLEPYMENRRDTKILTIGSLVSATHECMIISKN